MSVRDFCIVALIVVGALQVIYSMCTKYVRYKIKLVNCRYVQHSDVEKIYNIIDDMRRLIDNCPNKAISKMVHEVLDQMYKRIDYIVAIDNVTTKASKKITRKLIADTIRIFKEIDVQISEQVFKSIEEVYDESDFKRMLCQLRAYNELLGDREE